MMQLFGTPTSPYVRKVRAVARLHDLSGKIELVRVDAGAPSGAFLDRAPLGKVPVLVDELGHAIADSTQICLYLATRAGAPLPTAAPDRLALLTLADGLLDAGVALRKEERRPAALISSAVVTAERRRIARALDALESREAQAGVLSGPADIATVLAVCAVDWLGFRFPADDWCTDRPALAAGLGRLAGCSWFRDTDPRNTDADWP